MRTKGTRLLIAFVMLFISQAAWSQQGGGSNDSCETAAPFCTGTVYSFPAGVNSGAGQSGPFYSCLLTRPNPAWYYMKVDNPGNIIIQMHSEPGKDIDFCCWGPFSSQDCCGQLTQPKIVSCSYSISAYETCNIPNGQTGQYYMLIITNYSNDPCNIIFQQTGGTGTTDCTILPPACTSNGPVCAGQTIQLSAQSVANATYFWWGPAGFASSLQNPVITNATPANSGEYFLRIEVNGQGSVDTSTTYVNVYQPVANAGNDTTIMNGVYTTLHGSCSGGSGNFRYKWSPSSLLLNDSIPNPRTVNLFSATVFTLTITDDSASCQSTDLVTINIAGGPLAVNAVANPQSICKGSSTQLLAIGSGGAGTYSYQWSGPGGFSSSLPSPTVAPAETSTYHVSAFDGYNTVQSDVTVKIIPSPVPSAGPNKSIPNGTYTYLSGSVVNGSSNYYYSWSPASKLINAGIQNPQTANLSETTIYSLTVTDLVTNCVSDPPSNVTVEVTGVALNTHPIALPPEICIGDSARLYAAAGGGNIGHYTYSWTSDPPGFTSVEAEPYVKPITNTTYQVEVYDEYNYISGSTVVELFPQPVVELGETDTITVCIFDTVTLDAGNEGAAYLWSNGSTDRRIRFGTTGIGFDSQHYSVAVANQNGCRTTGEITVNFSFDLCTGVNDPEFKCRIRLYPNPASEKATVEIPGTEPETRLVLMNLTGIPLFTLNLTKSGDIQRGLLDVSRLAPGIYLVHLFNQDHTGMLKLFVE